jgi:hypothetical protein
VTRQQKRTAIGGCDEKCADCPRAGRVDTSDQSVRNESSNPTVRPLRPSSMRYTKFPIAYGSGRRHLMIDIPGRSPTSCVFAVEVVVSYKDLFERHQLS